MIRARSYTPPLSSLALLIILATPDVAIGQPSESEEGEGDTVSTRAGAPDAVEDARLPSGFVTRIPLGEVGPAGDGLASALERAPGMYVRRQSSFGQPAYIQVRGGNPRQVVVLLNGIRIKVPTGLGFDVGSLAVAGIDEARVYRGGSGVVHGAGALTGALELRASPDRRSGWEVRARTLAGSFRTSELGTRAEFGSEGGSARVVVNRRQSAGDFPFVDEQGVATRRVNNDHVRTHVLTSGVWENPTRYLGGTLLFDTASSGVAGPSEFQQIFGKARFDEQRLIATTDGGVRSVLSGPGWDIDIARVFGIQAREQRYTNEDAVLGGGRFESLATSVGLDSGFEAALYTNRNNFLRLGLSARRDVYSALDAREDRLDAKRRTLGVSLSDEQLLLDEKVSLVVVGRQEHIDGEDRDWAPRTGALGAVVRATDWFEARANLARTFRAPDFDELFLDTEFVRGSPDLDPERATLADVGITLRAERDVARAEIVGFVGRARDQIIFLPTSAYLIEARNLDRVDTSGVEFLGAISPKPRLPLSLSYTLTDARRPELADAIPLPNQPRHRLDASARLDLSRLKALGNLPALRAEARGAWRSEITLDNFASRTNPAWWRVDIGIVLAPTSWLKFRADATNLLDHRQAVDGLQRPLPGRAYFFSMELEAEGGP